MKHKGLIIASIIALAVVIFFLVRFLVVGIINNYVPGIGVSGIMTNSNNVIYDQEFKMEDIQSVNINSDAGDVKIKESKDDKIRVVLYGEYEEDAKVNQRGSELNINNTHKRFKIIDLDGTKNNVEVYLPASYSKNIKIDNDYGECIITDLPQASLEVDCDAGNVKVGIIKNANIQCDMGNARIKEVLDMCQIKVDCGNGEIEQLNIKRNSYMIVNMGNATINQCQGIFIDADVDLGETQINNNDRRADVTMRIEVDCGNINVN